ncbi:hypothetical protein [Neorhodopirellula lusitana]|uniref:hypothetical protein n=1 Tax=Neorhodopirellula lusitana TaxID=445327 RepID=UPI0024B66202|nr:hypothetical protein [Neorhodopirellula lusitana]
MFDKWYPNLQDFSQTKRAATPIPRNDHFTANDVLARRILEPKIAPSERVPQRGNCCAAFFTAPLAVLPLVMNEWPSEYRNAVFLTPDELREWNSQYDEPEDARWWYCFQNWDVDFDPPSDSFWLEHSEYVIPAHARSAIATWGLSWGSLAGGVKAELWSIENGTEQLMGLLGDATF